MLKNLLFLCGGFLAAVLCFAIIDQWFYSFGMVARCVWIVALAGIAVWWIATRIAPLVRLRVSPEYAAYSVELDEPEFQHALTSYVTLRNDRDAPGLRGIVVRSIGARAAKHLTTSGMSMPTETLGNFRPGLFAGIMFAGLILYAVFSPKNTAQSISRLAAPLADIAPPARVTIKEVQPGDTETLYGRELEIFATIDGLKKSDSPRVVLSGPVDYEIPLAQQQAANEYAATISSNFVSDSFQYQLVAGDATTSIFNVTVRDEPTVNIAEVQYKPHAYTKLSPRTSSIGAIDGLEGTRVTVIANANRKIVRGRIEFNPREVDGRTSATAGFAPLDISDDGRTVSAAWNLRTGRRGGGQLNIDSYRLRVWDDTDTSNSDPIVYPIQVSPDLAPEARITVPVNWPKDVPLGTEQLIEVRAVDPDFGLAKVELRVRRGTRLLETVELLSSESGERGNQILNHSFSPDLLGLMTGDLLTIEAVAMDNRTDVEGAQPDPNVVVSDPIELRIVERPAPDELVDDGDGLKKPADASSAEQQQAENEGQEGEQGDSGQTSESGQESAQEQQGGGGSSEDQAGQKGEGQGSGGQSSDQPQSGENQSGENNAGENNAGENGSSEGQANENPSGSEGESGSESDGDGTGESQKDSAAGSDPADAQQPGQTEQPGQDGESGESANGGEQSTEGSDQGQSGTNQSTGEPGKSGQSGKQETPASSDGEAIERIRDYLKEKQQSQNEAGKAESQPDNGSQSENAGSNGRQGDKANSSAKPDPDAGQAGAESKAADDKNQTNEEAEANDSQTGAESGTGADPGSESQTGKKPGAESKSEPGTDPASEKNPNSEAGSTDNPTSPESTGSEGTGEKNSEQASGEASSKSDEQSSENSSAGKPESAESAEKSATPDSNEGAEGGSQGQPKNAESGSGSDGQTQAGSEDKTNASSADQSQQGSASNDNQETNSGNTSESANDNQQGTKDGGQSEGGQNDGGKSSQTGSQSNASPPKNPEDGKLGESADGNAVGNNNSGEAMPSGTQPGKADAPQAPDPVDVEAAKEATDLVLDSLKNQRENPDQELLDRLGWTPDQLRNFVDRWEKTRSLGQQNDPAAQRQYEESLKSLGIRPPGNSGPRKSLGRDDQLRDIQDTGQRMAAPPQFRDAIEAYRRSLRGERSGN